MQSVAAPFRLLSAELLGLEQRHLAAMPTSQTIALPRVNPFSTADHLLYVSC
jgi:hypothetical protein